jgi:hypothetical protein
MFVGHYSVSFAARPLCRGVPLWVWFIAVQWLDILWSLFVLLGIEKLHIVPGFTEANSYDLYYMPYTHGLLGAISFSALFGAVVAWLTPGNRGKVWLLVGAASFSHWILDAIVHVPDLPLYGNSAKVGFGLWRHVFVTLPLELIILLAGAWWCARAMRFVSVQGRRAYWAFVAALVGLQVYANFGPPPASPQTMAATALLLYAALAGIAGLVERLASRTAVAREVSL